MHVSRAMTRARIALGKIGEDLACQELERRGYAIVARRYRRRGGELDIIARDGKTMVFVEVKAREGRAFGEASEAVTPHKRLTITRLASTISCAIALQTVPAGSTSCRSISTRRGR